MNGRIKTRIVPIVLTYNDSGHVIKESHFAPFCNMFTHDGLRDIIFDTRSITTIANASDNNSGTMSWPGSYLALGTGIAPTDPAATSLSNQVGNRIYNSNSDLAGEYRVQQSSLEE